MGQRWLLSSKLYCHSAWCSNKDKWLILCYRNIASCFMTYRYYDWTLDNLILLHPVCKSFRTKFVILFITNVLHLWIQSLFFSLRFPSLILRLVRPYIPIFQFYQTWSISQQQRATQTDRYSRTLPSIYGT